MLLTYVSYALIPFSVILQVVRGYFPLKDLLIKIYFDSSNFDNWKLKLPFVVLTFSKRKLNSKKGGVLIFNKLERLNALLGKLIYSKLS